MFVFFAGLLGLFSVAFGAFTEHSLRLQVSEEYYRFLLTAIRYNQIHAVVLTGLGLGLLMSPRLQQIRPFTWSAFTFLLGTILFSFSIYAAVLLDSEPLTYITPVGGTLLMLAWLLLAYAGLSAARQHQRD